MIRLLNIVLFVSFCSAYILPQTGTAGEKRIFTRASFDNETGCALNDSLIMPDLVINTSDELQEDTTRQIASFSNIYTQPKFIITASLITAGLFATDNETYQAIHTFKVKNRLIKDLSPVITQMGDGKFSLAVYGSFFLHYCFFDNRQSLETAKIGMESFLLSGIAVQFFKQIFGRERPSNASVSGGRFHAPFSFFSSKSNNIANYDSFPSGHTATAFSCASTLAELYPDGIVPYISYGLGALVALSRVTERAHWLSDCFVGGIIGIVSTKAVIYFNQKSSFSNISPIINKRYVGANYSLNF